MRQGFRSLRRIGRVLFFLVHLLMRRFARLVAGGSAAAGLEWRTQCCGISSVCFSGR